MKTDRKDVKGFEWRAPPIPLYEYSFSIDKFDNDCIEQVVETNLEILVLEEDHTLMLKYQLQLQMDRNQIGTEPF